jgi:hypothetical protein
MDLQLLLAILNSRLVRYLFKVYINHTVNTAENPLKEIPMVLPPLNIGNRLTKLVGQIVKRQQRHRYYPYWWYEQPEIDSLVYQLYGLAKEDVAEVESWFARRYPRLARVTADEPEMAASIVASH